MTRLLLIALLLPFVIAAPLRGLVSSGHETRETEIAFPRPGSEILISAADFVVPVGVAIDESSEGSQNLAKIVTGDKLSFTVNLEVGGRFRLQARISNADNVGAFFVVNSETNEIYGQVDALPPTWAWDQWVTVRLGDVNIPAGFHTLEILVLDGGFNLGWFSLTLVAEVTGTDLADATPSHFLVAATDLKWAEGITVDPLNGNLGEIDAGDYLKYEINIPILGTYAIHVQVASLYGEGSFVAKNSETQHIYGRVDSIPETGGWHIWTTVSMENITFEPGLVPFEILVVQGGWNMMHFSVERTPTTVINAADDVHILIPSTSLNNSAGVEAEGPQIIGNMSNTTFLKYNLDVPVTGNYRLDLQVASMNGSGAFLVIDGETQEIYGSVDTIPATGGWYNWTVVNVDDLDLDNGTVPLEIIVVEEGFNLLFMSLKLNEIANKSDSSNISNSSDTIDYDITVDLAGNPNQTLPIQSIPSAKFFFPASAYDDMNGIELEPSSEGGDNVGSIDVGDWVTYQVDLPSSGNYKVEMRVASHMGMGLLEFVDGRSKSVYGSVDIPLTGWWQIYTTILDELNLPGGTYPLQIRALEAGWNFLWFSLEKIEDDNL